MCCIILIILLIYIHICMNDLPENYPQKLCVWVWASVKFGDRISFALLRVSGNWRSSKQSLMRKENNLQKIAWCLLFWFLDKNKKLILSHRTVHKKIAHSRWGCKATADCWLLFICVKTDGAIQLRRPFKMHFSLNHCLLLKVFIFYSQLSA